MYDRYFLSPTAKRRRRIVARLELLIAAIGGAGIYVLTGLALRWLELLPLQRWRLWPT